MLQAWLKHGVERGPGSSQGGQGSTACPLHKLQPLFFLCAGNLCPLGSKKAPRGKEKREREKENENDFNFFFWRRNEADIESE